MYCDPRGFFSNRSNKKITSSHYYYCGSSYLVLHSQAQFFSQFLLIIQKGRGPMAFVLGLRLCSPSPGKVWEIPAAKGSPSVSVPPSLAMKTVPVVVGDTHRYPGRVRRKVRVPFISCVSLCVSTSMCSELSLEGECKCDALLVSHPGNASARTFLFSQVQARKTRLFSPA